MLPGLSPLLSSQHVPASAMDYTQLSTAYAAGLRSPAIPGVPYNSLILPSLVMPGGFPISWPYILPEALGQADFRAPFFRSPLPFHTPSFVTPNNNASQGHILTSSGHLDLSESQPNTVNLGVHAPSFRPAISAHSLASSASDSTASLIHSAQAMDILAKAALWDLSRPSERIKRQNSELNDASSSSTADGDSDSEGEEQPPSSKRKCLANEVNRLPVAASVMLQPFTGASTATFTLPRTVGSAQQPALHLMTPPNLPYPMPYIVPPLKSAMRAMPQQQGNNGDLGFAEQSNGRTPVSVGTGQLRSPTAGQQVAESSCATSKRDVQREWAFRHANSDWAKYNWHVRSGGRYIMTERAYRRYFACDHPGCPAVLYEDSPVEPKTGEAIRGGEMRMTLQKEHNHSPPDFSKPCNELVLRASFLLKSMSPTQVREQLIFEAGNGIGIPSTELIKQIADKHRFVRKDKR